MKEEWDKAVSHINFCVELYKLQMTGGRLFLHEHPDTASSWGLESIVWLAAQDLVHCVKCDMCAFGMTATDEMGEAPVRKTTRLMSNSPEVLKRVDTRCTNRDGEPGTVQHRHVQLVGGKAKQCQVYPRAF